MKILRFILALIRFILFGEEVTREVKDQRLSICQTCPMKQDKKCGYCGCYLDKKASWSSESCPENKW